MNYLHGVFFLLSGFGASAQNLVPNPSFENLTASYVTSNLLDCSIDWRDNNYTVNPAMNTADLHYNGSWFLTSINAYDGNRFIGMDCGAANPEYIQVKLTASMVAGTRYCVSFYTSLFNQWNTPTPYIGAYFSATRLIVNPYVAGIAASVQAAGPTDPTKWIQVSETYLATGGEQYMTIGCFRDNVPLVISYTYVDMVDVHAMNVSVDLGPDQMICKEAHIQLDAGTGATAYLWNTGETNQSITASTAGTYWVQKFDGACAVTDTVILSREGCNDPPTVANPPVEGELFIPDSFTPNGDGINDYFGAKGEFISNYELIIYDRWGEKIFSSESMNEQWDGTYSGKQAEEGVYVYSLRYQNAGRKKWQQGHVVLIR